MESEISPCLEPSEESQGGRIEETSDNVHEGISTDNVNDDTTRAPPDTVFNIDRSCIPTVPQNDQDDELQDLGIQVYNKDVLEEGILHQVDEAFSKQNEIQTLKQKKAQAKREILHKTKKRLNEVNDEEVQKNKEAVESSLPNMEETEMERKIRMGEMTPFGTFISSKPAEMNAMENIEQYLRKQLEMEKKSKKIKPVKRKSDSSVDLVEKSPKKAKTPLKKKIFFPKKRKLKESLGTETSDEAKQMKPGKLLSEKTALEGSSGSEYFPTDNESNQEEPKIKAVRRRRKKIQRPIHSNGSDEEWKTDDSDWEYSDEEKYVTSRSKKSSKEVDDGNVDDYLKRMATWEKSNSREEIESNLRHLDNGYKVPFCIWSKLYNYQKVGVQWLWELNIQRCGGILGDEMGLGKTIQVISFLTGLSVSKLTSRHGMFRGLGPVLIICPTTVMHQWVKEFHDWWPQFRVALLHESGNFSGKRSCLVRDIVKNNGILVTSYVSSVQQSEILLPYTWHYVILDEGHKIRNPDSQAANTVKQLKTPHRLILSGSPMQNNLRELWSLFDFIFPGKLGTLPVFMAEFAVPITQGGYTNATQIQVATAYKCATVLRDTISPYLLRRMKDDVKSHINLPMKNEQVLFCRLSEEQRQLYKEYLDSGEVDRILTGRYKIFVGLINLRKICNHPDLYSGGPKHFKWENFELLPEEEHYGFWKRAGKMIVVETLLKIWKKQGHRVLLFTQSKQMLHILEAFIKNQNYEYLKIDGSTGVGSRQPIIKKFNEDKNYFVFLSTTHVGGLGVNLTGANRVVIYDPDWNPATDTQARERAWRIGQMNQVTIYRLVTAGTIEEKIYHRQIFKQFLTNKVLKDPRQRRFFKSNDLFELFTLKETDDNVTETSALFAGTGSEVQLKDLTHKQKVKKIKEKLSLKVNSVAEDLNASNLLSKEKIENMKKMAQALSKKIALELEGKKQCETIDSSKAEQENWPLSSEILNGTNAKTESSKDEHSVKHKKKKKKKSKRLKFAKFDGEEVPHLMKQSEYQQSENADHAAQDDYILKKLLSKSGVQTALKHDRIMEGGPSDYALVEGEAEKVAKEAVKALKESRRQYRRPFEEPEMTETTVVITPTSKPRFGGKKFGNRLNAKTDENNEKEQPMSSAELLARIRERNRLLTPNDDSLPSNPLSEHSELLADIRNFISFGTQADNRATTQEIIDKFRDKLPAGRSPLFKALLQEICDFHRTPSGEGIWKLKPEFRW